MAETRKSKHETINNNQKDTQSEDKIEFWDENLATLFQKLNKYLPKHFPLVELFDNEEGIFIYSSTFDKVGIKISRDGKKILSQVDENEVRRKVQSGNDLRIFLSNYLNNDDKRNFKFDIFGLPMKLDVKEFVTRYAPKVKRYQMKEIGDATDYKSSTWDRNIKKNRERFIPDDPVEEFKRAFRILTKKYKNNKEFEFDKYLTQLNVSIKQFKEWDKKGLLKKCVILNYEKNVFYTDL